jgi:Peptidase M15
MQLTEHFSLEEMTSSEKAAELHIENTAPVDVIDHLKVLAIALEGVRAYLGFPLVVGPTHSGYRCPELNKAVGGVGNSAHLTGYAADFVCPQFGAPIEIVQAIVKNADIKFDQLIQEGTWVHLSVDPQMRGEILTAHFVGGKATYQHGVVKS